MIDLSTLETIYQVGKKIYGIVQSIKKAPEAIRELETQVLLVQSVLEALKRELEGREDKELIDWSTEPCLKMLERARELAKEANEFLEKATRETGHAQRKVRKARWILCDESDAKELAQRKVRKARWILCDESDAKELAEKFHKFHSSLSMVLTAIYLRVSRDATNDLRETNKSLQIASQKDTNQTSQDICADVR